ncbi:MAG: hypothetical protein JO340_19770 [Acidobacteriaceae bacterium]|nr:hypothetical protein [Acidobacteriaceae bacterium]
MPLSRTGTRALLLAASLAAALAAQTLSAPAPASNGHAETYEDDQVRIAIPAGWTRATGGYPSLEPYRMHGTAVVGSSVLQTSPHLLLQKDGYTLALAFSTSHASGADGGRFIEAFNIPWLDADQAWTCGLILTYIPQPASRALLFENMVVDAGDPNVRAKCRIPREIAEMFGPAANKPFSGERRWYGGYFTTRRGYFFDGGRPGCGSKLYSLTSAAKTPDQLPAIDDPRLAQITGEAIDIVDSIQYKRCAPRP